MKAWLSLTAFDIQARVLQTVRRCAHSWVAGSMALMCSFTMTVSPLQVYKELQEAIALTEEALTDLQSTEALKRGRQDTTDLATEPVPACEAISPLVQANTTNVQPLPQTTLVASKTKLILPNLPAG